ncbi:Methylmalonic aciduria and homocystinuria type D protein, mitochondrial [Hondaea fermentalgiana]|uniref:Methylmalonic aciduria and homocystinuria type D protein, mitochondrial n=1 Tax=Hondaea fermentalgiana TaxID=2315210 RepID=A0A2R5GHA1_9STRA|nr:Methylmalonic aciduria and homocystinuria type D protein, mitochondrial [Hondaea fermentalgiana]|eukprot:GBG29965.1 Methylmalonic aciduria and homocystinuria type D protein, mitochondrial [Hondaea fermentalgiana]
MMPTQATTSTRRETAPLTSSPGEAKTPETTSVLSDAIKEEVLRAMLEPQEDDGSQETTCNDSATKANSPGPGTHEICNNEESKSLAPQEHLFQFNLDDAAWDLSVHEAPKAVVRDLKVVFRSAIKEHKFDPARFKVVPTVQRTSLSTLAINEETAKEKDICLERFARLAERFCDALEARGFWADYTDPCCGLPMRSNGNTVYPDIQGLVRLRNFPTSAVGACHVALHPSWGECMYPATMFTVAPMETVVEVVDSILLESASMSSTL